MGVVDPAAAVFPSAALVARTLAFHGPPIWDVLVEESVNATSATA